MQSDGVPDGDSVQTPKPGDPAASPVGPAPAAFHDGPAHVIRYGNPAFLAAFGPASVGQPAREAMTSLPRAGFELMDRVLREGRPLARRVATSAGERRLVVVPRKDPETGETYGVTTHLRPGAPGVPPENRVSRTSSPSA
jgi:hypothetical protein